MKTNGQSYGLTPLTWLKIFSVTAAAGVGPWSSAAVKVSG